MTPELYRQIGLLYERMGALEDALTYYIQLKEKYGYTQEGAQADKYIGRVRAAMGEPKI